MGRLLIYHAFCRKALGEPLCISAVVVNHVVVLDPFHLLLVCGIKHL